MHSNRYIFIYATVMVTIVAAILSAAAMILQPFQEKNIRIEKMQQILKSAGIPADAQTAIEKYDESVFREITISHDGEILSVYENGEFIEGDIRAFDVDLRAELRKHRDHQSGRGSETAIFPMFLSRKDGDTLYIIPLLGRGLWGPVWGNIALKRDFNTVAGITLDHKSETPGLGAEISENFFQKQFTDKRIFDETGKFVSIRLVKGGVSNSPINPAHGVDAISGGTITCDGVTEMIEECLKAYLPFFEKQQKTQAPDENTDIELNENLNEEEI